MATSFTWRSLTATALAQRPTQEEKVLKAAVNTAPVAKRVAVPVAKKVATPVATPVAKKVATPVAKRVVAPVAKKVVAPVAKKVAKAAVSTAPVAKKVAAPMPWDWMRPMMSFAAAHD